MSSMTFYFQRSTYSAFAILAKSLIADTALVIASSSVKTIIVSTYSRLSVLAGTERTPLDNLNFFTWLQKTTPECDSWMSP